MSTQAAIRPDLNDIYITSLNEFKDKAIKHLQDEKPSNHIDFEMFKDLLTYIENNNCSEILKIKAKAIRLFLKDYFGILWPEINPTEQIILDKFTQKKKRINQLQDNCKGGDIAKKYRLYLLEVCILKKEKVFLTKIDKLKGSELPNKGIITRLKKLNYN